MKDYANEEIKVGDTVQFHTIPAREKMSRRWSIRKDGTYIKLPDKPALSIDKAIYKKRRDAAQRTNQKNHPGQHESENTVAPVCQSQNPA